MLKQLTVCVALTSLGLAGACAKKSNEGPFERAAERVNDVVDNIRDGDPPLKKKGALERAGESIDRQFDSSK